MNTALNTASEAMKRQFNGVRKRVSSRLDAFGPQLLQMDGEAKTIPEMLDWLKERDVTTSASNLSHFLKRRRGEIKRKELNEQLDGEKDVFETVEQWIEANPNPKLEAVIEMFKMLALKLATKKEAAPGLLMLADKLAGTAVRFVNDQSRAEYRKQKLIMEQEKHAEWVKCERMRAFELCLDEAKKYPEVADMYRAAFAALKKRQKENGEL